MVQGILSVIAHLLAVLLCGGRVVPLALVASFPLLQQPCPRTRTTTCTTSRTTDNNFFMRSTTINKNLRLRATPFSPDDDILVEKDVKIGNQTGSPTRVSLSLDFNDDGDNDDDDAKTTAATYLSSSTTAVTTTAFETVPKQTTAPPLSIFLLNFVAIIWGSQHAVIKMIVEDSAAGPFTLLRFGLAALIASPYTPGLSSFWGQQSQQQSSSSAMTTTTTVEEESSNHMDIQNAWRWGAEMGMWMFLGFSFQAIGLGTTTAQRSGFLLYLNVKFVPFFARIFMGRNISIPTWVSALAAFCGTALLALDGNSIGFNAGDAWSIAAAATSAMFILRLETASQQVPDASALNAACLWVVAFLAGLWSLFATGDASIMGSISTTWSQVIDIGSSHPWEIIYLSAVTTALANYIQTIAQRDVTAERASVIYSLDPVYGAIFSWFLLGETLGGPQAFVGAGLITVAAATNAFLDFTTSSNTASIDKEQRE